MSESTLTIPSVVMVVTSGIDILDVAKQELEQLTSQLESLKAEKRALMADLLTGNRRVCLPEPTTEAQKAA
ncbi:restriction endonuclease subunit S [Burkholderia ubonensis]|uniref:restriction endonuclease subunit S n=1 Tax=Burkholderia ubonensis TaxID=101571 RepID=UPI0012F81593|nr:hypothetical protein [Burkholderia ubonensis]